MPGSAAPTAAPDRAAEVLVLGSLNLDIGIGVPHLPVTGETVLGDDPSTGPGGKGGNQAVAAARLGTDVGMVGAVGDDAEGAALTAHLAAAGVDTAAVTVLSGRPTGRAVVMVLPDGDNAIVVSPGANAGLPAAWVADAVAGATGARVLLSQLEIPVDAVVAGFTAATGGTAADRALLRVLNVAPYRTEARDLIALADVVVMNRVELAALAGAAVPGSLAEAADLASRLADARCSVVITLGADGALAWPAGGRPVVVPAGRPTVVDTTGAGDAFCGALAAGLARGLDPVAAAGLGTAAGALAVARPGALPPETLASLAARLPRGESRRRS